MPRVATLLLLLLLLNLFGDAGADRPRELADPSKSASLPANAAGLYVGQGSQVETFVDRGRRCTATSRKFLSIEIDVDGAARWNGHNLENIVCKGDKGRSIPRSCWTSGEATVATATGGKLTLSTTATTPTAGPAIYEATLTRWKCGGISVDVPSNMAPVDGRSCVKLGPVEDYQLEAVAAIQCQYGEDFEDLKSATFKIEKDKFKIPITLLRKSSFVMRRAKLEVVKATQKKPLPANCAEESDGLVYCEAGK